MEKGRVQLPDRVLAEAICALEELDQRRTDDQDAVKAAREAGGDLERRIVHRARELAVAGSIEDALRHVRHVITLLVMAGIGLAVAAGAGAARAALGAARNEAVNFFWALATILGLQTVILLIWIILMIASRRIGARSVWVGGLGGAVFRLAQWLTCKVHRGPNHAAAVAAIGRVHMHGTLGKWTLSSVSNGLWLAFNIGCLAVLILLLSARTYTFSWETTILSARQYVPLTKAIAALPKAMGFLTPTEAQIAASELSDEPANDALRQELMASRQEWSGLLVGCVILYGFAPRLLLLGLCLGQRRVAAGRFRLNTSRPEYVRLQPRLMPATESIGVVDAEDDGLGSSKREKAVEDAPQNRPLGLPAILGFELPMKTANASWPPALHQVRWMDLGMVDGRDDQHHVLAQLAAADQEPSTIVVVVSLTSTPDRGMQGFLEALQGVVTRPMTVVLTSGDSLRHRVDAEQLERRVQDWRRVAMAAGAAPHRILEIDLDHLTQVSAAALAAIVDAKQEKATAPRERRIEAVFDLIVHDVSPWIAAPKAPTPAEQAELHRRIARQYGDQQTGWRDLLRLPRAAMTGNIAVNLKTSADRMIELLPNRLRKSPKWIAAGAAAGALGCVAAASFISPVAISALPLWSAIGAGLSAFASLRPFGSNRDDADESANIVDWPRAMGAAIRSAALFALLLELQGRGEVAITRALDDVLEPPDGSNSEDAINSVEEAIAWLDQLRHRLDLSLARESRP